MNGYPRDLGVALATIGLWLLDKMPEIAACFAAGYSIYCIYHLWDKRRKGKS